MIENEIFLDTAFAVSLFIPNDEHHDLAKSLAGEINANGIRMVTTRAVVLEIGNYLSRLRHRDAAIELMQSLDEDENVQIIPMTEVLYERGFELFCSRPDKEWGITDCISFIVMRERGIYSALTTDRHFQQAGFKALLREERS